MCRAHASKVGTDRWLGKVTGEIPDIKLKEFEKKFEKRSAGAVARAGDTDSAQRGLPAGAGASAGVARVMGAGEQQGEGVPGVSASGVGRFKRLRRAGFAVQSVGEDGVGGDEALGGEVDSGRGAAGAASSGFAARGRGGGRVVSGFGTERVEDVRAVEERRDEEARDRQRQRREEGTRGRMVDFRGRELERNDGGAFSLGK